MHTPICRDTAQLSICDDGQVKHLSAALDCLPTDIYQAVAFVGDRVCCIQAYIQKALATVAPRRTRIKVGELPPTWDEPQAP